MREFQLLVSRHVESLPLVLMGGAGIFLLVMSAVLALAVPAAAVLTPGQGPQPIVVPAHLGGTISPAPRAMLLPNWEVGENAADLLPNCVPGMGQVIFVGDQSGVAVLQDAPTTAVP